MFIINWRVSFLWLIWIITPPCLLLSLSSFYKSFWSAFNNDSSSLRRSFTEFLIKSILSSSDSIVFSRASLRFLLASMSALIGSNWFSCLIMSLMVDLRLLIWSIRDLSALSFKALKILLIWESWASNRCSVISILSIASLINFSSLGILSHNSLNLFISFLA